MMTLCALLDGVPLVLGSGNRLGDPQRLEAYPARLRFIYM